MTTDYLSLIPSANKGKPKFEALLKAVTDCFGGVSDTLLTLPDKYALDTARGDQLDTLGAWVGQTRLIPNAILIQFFGFDGNPDALAMGDSNFPSQGGRFYDEGEPITSTALLSDPEYRTAIKARIARNMAQGTTADIVGVLNFIFGHFSYVEDYGNMSIGIAIGSALTRVEQAMIRDLDLLPRPAGILIAWLLYFDPLDYFGFDGQFNAQSFGEEGSTTIGGRLAEEF